MLKQYHSTAHIDCVKPAIADMASGPSYSLESNPVSTERKRFANIGPIECLGDGDCHTFQDSGKGYLPQLP